LINSIITHFLTNSVNYYVNYQNEPNLVFQLPDNMTGGLIYINTSLIT